LTVVLHLLYPVCKYGTRGVQTVYHGGRNMFQSLCPCRTIRHTATVYLRAFCFDPTNHRVETHCRDHVDAVAFLLAQYISLYTYVRFRRICAR